MRVTFYLHKVMNTQITSECDKFSCIVLDPCSYCESFHPMGNIQKKLEMIKHCKRQWQRLKSLQTKTKISATNVLDIWIQTFTPKQLFLDDLDLSVLAQVSKTTKALVDRIKFQKSQPPLDFYFAFDIAASKGYTILSNWLLPSKKAHFNLARRESFLTIPLSEHTILHQILLETVLLHKTKLFDPLLEEYKLDALFCLCVKKESLFWTKHYLSLIHSKNLANMILHQKSRERMGIFTENVNILSLLQIYFSTSD